MKPGGIAALVWNKRLLDSAFMREVDQVVDRFATEHDADGAIREAGRSRIPGFFAPSPYREAALPNAQHFDLAGLLGRVFSASYVPAESDELRAAMTEVFHRHAIDGHVTFEYRTEVYWSSVTPG